jgi:hypothetical protein
LRAYWLSAGRFVPDAQHNDSDLVQSVDHRLGKVGGSGSLVLICRIKTFTFERNTHTTQHLSHGLSTLCTSDVFWFVIVDASYFFSYVA